jgi:hypothetical protein
VVLDNRDGRFSPTNLSGPYTSGGITQVRPWRPVRIRFTWAGILYEAFTGYAIDWAEGFSQARTGQGDAVVTVTCVDEMDSLARFDGSAQAPVGGGETSGQRIHRVLNNAGHTGLRDVDDGVMTMQPTTLAANTVDELKLTADSEGGAVYVGKDGAIIFDNIYALIENSRSNTIQATFGDNGTDLPYSSVTPQYNGDLLANMAAFARQNGSQVVSVDNASRALYGDKQDSRTDLMCEADPQVKAIADIWVQRFKDPEYRFVSMTVQPRRDPTRLFPQVLGREVRDLIRVKRQTPAGLTISQDVFISGISHAVSTINFVTTFALSSGTPYTSFTTSRFDTGKWDTATWFY